MNRQRSTRMATTSNVDLNRIYTKEERDALFDAYTDALARKDDEAADHILEQMPIDPDWAKSS